MIGAGAANAVPSHAHSCVGWRKPLPAGVQVTCLLCCSFVTRIDIDTRTRGDQAGRNNPLPRSDARSTARRNRGRLHASPSDLGRRPRL